MGKLTRVYLREIAVPVVSLPAALVELPERFFNQMSDAEVQPLTATLTGLKVVALDDKLIAVEKLELIRLVRERWPDLKIRVVNLERVNSEADCVELICRLATIDALSVVPLNKIPTLIRRNKKRGAKDVVNTATWSLITNAEYSTLFKQDRHFVD